MLSVEQLQKYALPVVILVFFGYRRLRVRAVKAKLPSLLLGGAQIVDVRSPSEFASGSNPSSMNIPLDQISSDYLKLDPSKPVVLCCATGMRSGLAARILKGKGFSEVINAGAWPNTLV